jgi:hypothetical protein
MPMRKRTKGRHKKEMSDGTVKHQPEMVEGPEAWRNFEGTMRKVLVTPCPKVKQPAPKHPVL